jgi:hypothetical protein
VTVPGSGVDADLRHLQADRGRRQDTQIAPQLSQMEASLDNGEFVPAISKQTKTNLERR